MMPPAPTLRRTGFGIFCASVPIMSWGISFVVIKTTMTEIPPLTLAFLRFFFAALIVWPLVSKAQAWRPIAREDRLPLFLLPASGAPCAWTLLEQISTSRAACARTVSRC
jgi:drug/metabolite transporter (DMT)-like permease